MRRLYKLLAVALCSPMAAAVTVTPGWQNVARAGSLPVTIEVMGTHTDDTAGELTFYVTEDGKQIPSRVYGKRAVRVTHSGQSHSIRVTIKGNRQPKRTVLVCASFKSDEGLRSSACSTTYIK